MPTNDFKTFATGGGANVMSQADYEVAAFLGTGFQSGIALSEQLNKVWRQSAFVASQIAAFMAAQTGSDILDDGNAGSFLALLTTAVSRGAGVRAARIVTASTTLNIALTDYAIGLSRTVAPAAMAANLPAVTDANIGEEWVIEDLAGNFSGSPITVTPPAGTIAGRPNFILNEDRQSATFRYYGSALWSVKT